MAITYEDDAPKISYEERRAPSSNTDVAVNAADKGIAGLLDSVLNTPNNIINMAKAAIHATSGSDAPFQATPGPDYARRGFEAMGMIKPGIQPQGMIQKGIDYGVQGAVGGALTGGGGLARTVAGAGLGALSGEAAGVTQEVTGSPALAATAGMLPAAAGAFRNPQKDAAAMSRNFVRDETLARAQAEGYKTPPSAIDGGSFVGNRIEGIAGKAALNQETTLHNQPITNKIARREAGLKPDESISEGTLEAARTTIAAPYREVASISAVAAKALDGMKQARADAKLEWNHYNRSGEPAALKRAQASDNRADMYETVIDKVASKQGAPDLLDRLRDARTKLAKNYAVDRAVNVGSGDVDAQVIGRMLDKGAPLTGGLETIGRFAQSFGQWTRDAAKVPAPGVSKLEALASFGLGAAGHAAAPGMGEIAAALPLALPPIARGLALSPLMQGQRQYGPGVLSQTAQQTSPIVTQGILADILRRQQ